MERVVVELRYRGELLSPGGVAKCPTSNFQLPPTQLQSCIQSCQVESPRQRPTSHVQRPTSNVQLPPTLLQSFFKVAIGTSERNVGTEHRNGTSERKHRSGHSPQRATLSICHTERRLSLLAVADWGWLVVRRSLVVGGWWLVVGWGS